MATAKYIDDFIKTITPYVQKYCLEFGYGIPSAVIAQACLESGYGTSDKAKRNNFFGLKYRKNRCPSSDGTFKDGSQEQKADGTYVAIEETWFSFPTIEAGIKGYFEFLNTSSYENLIQVTDPTMYLANLRKDGYCTSMSYVADCMNIVNKYDLTKYDTRMVKVKHNTVLKARKSNLGLNICLVKKSDLVTMIEKGDIWCRCKVRGYTGYILTKKLEVD